MDGLRDMVVLIPPTFVCGCIMKNPLEQTSETKPVLTNMVQTKLRVNSVSEEIVSRQYLVISDKFLLEN